MITIILIIFTIAALIAILPIKSQIYKQNLYFGFALVLIMIAGLRGEGVDRDYSNYVYLFENFSNSLIEPLFYFISFIIHKFLFANPLYLFVIFAFIGVSTNFWAIKQLSDLWFLALVIYIGEFFILHDLTQIRVGVASGFLLLCIKPIYERNLKRFLFYSIIAILSHYSAILILPLWFLNISKPRKTLLIFAIPISYIIYFTGINIIANVPVPIINEKLQMYQMLQRAGVGGFDKINVFNLMQLFKIALYYFLIFKFDLILEKNKYSIILIKIFAISLCSFPLFAIMPVISFRISELFGIVDIILIPSIIYILKPHWLSRIIVVLIGLLFILTTLFYNNILLM